MLSFARTSLAIAFAILAAGCTTFPVGGRKVAAETEWSSVPAVFQPYFSRLIRRIDRQWNREIAGLDSYPPPGSRVVIRFHMNSAGLVTRIDDVDENAGKAATYACVNAITVPQPFPKWSEDMIAEVGDEQEITFAFYFHDNDEPRAAEPAARNPLPVAAHGD